MVKYFILLFVFISSTADAAYWVKYDPVTMQDTQCVIDDGVKAGAVASYDTYDSPLSGWLRSDISECDDAKLPDKKIDLSVVVGSRIVDMTQDEIDSRDAAQQSSRDSDVAASLEALDNKISNVDMNTALTKVDAAIDNIGNLNDAKVFLKKLVRAIVSLHTSDE